MYLSLSLVSTRSQRAHLPPVTEKPGEWVRSDEIWKRITALAMALCSEDTTARREELAAPAVAVVVRPLICSKKSPSRYS